MNPEKENQNTSLDDALSLSKHLKSLKKRLRGEHGLKNAQNLEEFQKNEPGLIGDEVKMLQEGPAKLEEILKNLSEEDMRIYTEKKDQED